MVMRRLLQLNKLCITVIRLGAEMHVVLVSIHHWFLPLYIILGIDARTFIIKYITVILRWYFVWRSASWDLCMVSKINTIVSSSYVPISFMIL